MSDEGLLSSTACPNLTEGCVCNQDEENHTFFSTFNPQNMYTFRRPCKVRNSTASPESACWLPVSPSSCLRRRLLDLLSWCYRVAQKYLNILPTGSLSMSKERLQKISRPQVHYIIWKSKTFQSYTVMHITFNSFPRG